MGAAARGTAQGSLGVGLGRTAEAFRRLNRPSGRRATPGTAGIVGDMQILTALQLVLASLAGLSLVLCALAPLGTGSLVSHDTADPSRG